MRFARAFALAALLVAAISCGNRTRGDLDGNGRAQLLWQNTESGELSAWTLDRKAQPRKVVHPESPLEGGWRVVVVNHLMQVVATTAMEAPAGGDPDTLKDAMVAVFRATETASPISCGSSRTRA